MLVVSCGILAALKIVYTDSIAFRWSALTFDIFGIAAVPEI